MKIKIILPALLITAISFCVAQERSGLSIGVQYETTSHENPYVFVGGSNAMAPESVTGFSDNTSQFYFPLGYTSYSPKGYSELSTYAFHLLFVGAINLIGSQKQYVYNTDKTYSGDSYADGYTPVFSNSENIGKEYGNFNGNKGLEASFNDLDLFRMVYSGSMKEAIGIPVMLGLQGGIGNLGVHFAQIEEGHEPSDINNDKTGLVNFNDAADLYFGVNTGYVTQIFNGDLAMLLIQYDWYYFIKGVTDNSKLAGHKLTFELTYFPFDYRKKFLKNLFFKAFLKTSVVPYMKDFADKTPTDYSFTKFGIGVNYFIL